jgi:5-methyltetrahydropteroyltriglutamate--homocysteine methyltransferase
MAPPLPILPVTVIGAYAHPAWLYASKEWLANGRFGETDARELYDDAVDRAIQDQERAGVDVITDGEMRRESFVWAFAKRATGLREVDPPRKVGEIGLDLRSVWETTGPVDMPKGLGAVEEFLDLTARTSSATKISIPGPFAMTSFMRPVEHYRDRPHLAEAFVPAIKDEVRRLAEAGCTFIQLDEPATPGYGYDPHEPADIARLYNACVEGVTGVKLGLHICFGTFRKIPYAKRTYAPYFPDLLEARADQFLFEFANREMAEIENWSSWAPDRELCAGIVDVRTHYLETPEDVAERARICLEHVDPERLWFSPDCGFRYVPRWLARAKLEALVEGVRRVRGELAGQAQERLEAPARAG